MGKVKTKFSRRHANHHANPPNRTQTVTRRGYSQPPQAKGKKTASSSRKNGVNGPHQQQRKLNVPFQKHDRVLLVGEGDFSFALSLWRRHGIENVTATCLDGKEELARKYPGVRGRIARLLGEGEEEIGGGGGGGGGESDLEWNGFDHIESPPGVEKRGSARGFVAVHYGVNATKLSTTHKKVLRPHAPFTKIVFNFPHVGGLSTDVNRQVRANQELLVGFFNAAKGLLASGADRRRFSTAATDRVPEYGQDDLEFDDDGEPIVHDVLTPARGQILVTLFEGEPYVLWNVRDLARHCGLRVVESFRFPWEVYPGYQHARTIGEITTGLDRGVEGKRKGAWRGEERDARCFVMELKDEESEVRGFDGSATGGNMAVLGKRRKGQDSEDDGDGD